VRQVLDQTAEGWCDADRPYGEGDHAQTPERPCLLTLQSTQELRLNLPTLGTPDEAVLFQAAPWFLMSLTEQG
jgi:hypothetical protein